MSRSFFAAIALGAIVLAACNGLGAMSATPAPAVARDAIAPRVQLSATAQSAPGQPTQTAASTQARIIAPTPACGSALKLTPEQTEGPYYKANSPERLSLIEPGMSGTKVVVVGYVLTQECKPIPRALMDFWQADDKGDYDNTGFRMRGRQFTDDVGRYYLETIFPGLYPGRTRHIHVKVQPPNRRALTTQLYFPGEAGNPRDSIFNAALVVNLQDTNAGKIATFNFVIAP